MGKNLQQNNSSHIRVENGCMYNLFHVLHHHRWNRVRKMLPNKRHANAANAKQIPQQETRVTISGARQSEERIDHDANKSNVGDRATEPTSVSKTSMKSRIRALISEEMSKRRGKHRRSCTYPHTSPNPVSDPQTVAKGNSSTIVHQVDDESSVAKKRKCDICAAMLTVSYLRQRRSLDEEPLRFEENLEKNKQEKENMNHDSIDQNVGSLDIFEVRKEGLLKMLKDTHYLHSRRPLNLTKSMSFPMLGSNRKKFDQLEELIHKMRESTCIESSKESLKLPISQSKRMLTRPESFKNPNPNPNPNSSQREINDIKPTNHFKNLRQKLGCVIKESKKERHRIIMDSVFHKVPYGRRSSKIELEKGKKNSGNDHSFRDKKSFRKTSSFNESLSKYNRLLEQTTSIREEKGQNSDRLKLRASSTSQNERPKFKRILSSPNFSSFLFKDIDDSPDRTHVDSRTFDNQKSTDQKSTNQKSTESQIEFSDARKSVAIDLDETVDENLNLGQILLEYQEQIDPKLCVFNDEVESLRQDSVFGYSSFEMDAQNFTPISILQEEYSNTSQQQDQSFIHNQTMEMSQIHDQKKELTFLHFDFDSVKDDAEFRYVKHVLDLSGFSRDEPLGAWYSEYQPIDPLLFEELETNFLIDEENAQKLINDHHLLLFDLINEVLLEIYEKSLTYCPKPLTFRSKIHPMPLGYHVLEDVWSTINVYLKWEPELQQTLDDAVSRDLAKGDGWMNLQSDAEYVGLELEDIIFDDLLDELVFS